MDINSFRRVRMNMTMEQGQVEVKEMLFENMLSFFRDHCKSPEGCIPDCRKCIENKDGQGCTSMDNPMNRMEV